MCSERAGFSQRHAGLKRQEGLWDDRQRWLPRQQGWTHIPKGCNDRSEVHPCTWRDIRSLCLWCNCAHLDEKFPKLPVATCLLNDQNDKKNIKFPNLTFLRIKSPQHPLNIKHVVYALLYVYHTLICISKKNISRSSRLTVFMCFQQVSGSASRCRPLCVCRSDLWWLFNAAPRSLCVAYWWSEVQSGKKAKANCFDLKSVCFICLVSALNCTSQFDVYGLNEKNDFFGKMVKQSTNWFSD